MSKRSLSLFFSLAAALPLGRAQTPPKPPPVDRATAYYNYSLGHIYAEQAGAYGNRGDYLNKAIDHYRQAIKADPTSRYLSEELSDLYIQAGRLKEAVMDAEEALRQNPDDINARRILGRIYSRLIGDAQQGKINEEMLQRAIEQYQKISQKQPKDIDSWLVLGRLYKVAHNSVESEKAFQKVIEIEPDNEDALAGLAMVYADLGDVKKASDLLSRVAERNPSLRTLAALAGAYEQMREYKLAAETLRRALQFSPHNSELKRALAQNLVFSDQFEAALELFRSLVEEDPKDVQSHLRISQIYRQLRQFDKAREANDKAREQDPKNLEVLYNEVSLLEQEGKAAEAIGILKEILSSTAKRSYSPAERSNRAILIERLGALYRSNDQTKEAVDAYRELAALESNLSARGAALIVETYRQARDFTKAQEEAEQAYKKHPEDRMVRVVRASLLADMGKADIGAADIRKLLDGKSDRETYLTLAQIFEKGKNYAEMAKAIDASEKLSTTTEEKETIHFMRGAMYEKLKKYAESEAEFRKVIELNAGNTSAMNYLGYMLADRNVRLQEAKELIQKALDQDPQNGAYLDSLGWVYFRMDKLDEAEEYLMRSLRRVAHDPTVNDHLGDVYLRQGKVKEAIAQWEASLKEWNASPPSELDPNEVAKVQKKLEGARIRLAREAAAGPAKAKP